MRPRSCFMPENRADLLHLEATPCHLQFITSNSDDAKAVMASAEMDPVRVYRPAVRLGNWREDVTLEEEALREFLQRKDRGELTVQKTGVLRQNLLQPVSSSGDRSRPGLTMTAIGAVDLQGAGGNWATVGGRSRGGRRVHRQREKRKGKSVGLRIGTLNVGTMTGKGRELADMMERRKVDILCVQETRWKGSKARSIGAGFKLFYYGVDSKRNGVGVVLKEEFVRNLLEVKRVSDRVMSLKLEIEGVMLNVVSGYAPQVGCELEEKERFWSELDEVMESIPTGERVVIGADFNGHVGEGNTGDEEVMGKFGFKERNLEGQMVVDFAKRMDMGVVNTYFQKREEHRVTYKSGGRRTQVDYILCRRGNLKEISDCKVVVGESVARQHRMVVCRMTLMVCKKKRSKIEIEKKTKWWKLKKEECCEEFRQKLKQALGGQVVLPDDWETTAEVIRETGRKVLGVSSGRRKEDKETWWWNEEVQDSVQRKRLAKKKWDMDRTEENRQEYKELQRRVKREVSKAKQKAYEELYTRLDTREGEKDLYRLARQRDRDGKDVQQVRVIKDRDGRVLTSEESVQRRWKEYFEELMNEENEREKRVEGVNSVEQKVDKIRKDEVRKALKRMKSGKAVDPDDIPVEVWKCLGEAAVEFLTSLFNRVLESERMPEEWRRSVLVPIFKNKGDVQSCSNYRGIKLMSHTMKLWERVVEARLRKVVEICEQQYGFMPRKSTTDAIFALRILMEKYRDGQRELHCVFVDLEKAYDRVPREELWYCMRKSGVAEKYVRVVQDMYERSRTVVRCAVGQTEEFKVEVGLHQGSALSPFLFAIVMDQLSEEVRQESPWTMMFADDIVICSESREQVEENLQRWRFALERRGMKVSGSKTEYMCVNEREGSGTVRLQGEEVKKVQEFKYLGSTVQSNGECGKEVKKRMQAGWNGWRKAWGVLCERKISARIKGKVYRTVVRAAMLYGLETVSLRKRQESELEVAELKMLRFSLGVTRLDRIRNEYIRGTAHVGRLGDKVREARLRWFGHVQRRESEYIGRRMLDMELPGRRQRGRPKRRCNSAHILAKIFLFQVSLTVSPDGWLHFGDTVMLVNSRGTKRDPCDLSVLSIIADLSNITSHIKTNSEPFLQGPCQVGGASSTQPCVRNTFIITSVDECADGEILRYEQNFALRTTPDFGVELYLASDHRTFQKCAKKSRLQEVSLVPQKDFLCWWKLLYFDPQERLEHEGFPVQVSTKVLLSHCKTNQCLAALPDHTLWTAFGKEFEITAHTFLDSHKAEQESNHWIFMTSDPREEEPSRNQAGDTTSPDSQTRTSQKH
ncbi:hypothetical protein QTP70_021697 [Hemibagrus guttatus]|uniref:ribonuclease H n=1 Tax=Hemibagrus guttatus TaxID=175788 RepID=A0AAE0RBB7_9TELE|nr:hypothetical protein QTP70_021697 [Hemibagrus guttatus]